MNKRIFPFCTKCKPVTWYNYSNYINWLYEDAQSLQYYIDYFNPDFHILNQNLHAVSSNTFEPTVIEGNENLEINLNSLKKLKFREGIFNTGSDNINLGFINLKSSQIIFAKERYKTDQIATQLSHYLIISQPPAGIFLPQSANKKLNFTFYKNGQLVVGTSLILTLELSPSRYYITNPILENWIRGGMQWSIDNIYWEKDGTYVQQVQNDQNIIWTNSYPIMHEIYLVQGTQYEEFFFDNDSDVVNNTSNGRGIIKYIIKTKNITQSETDTDLWSNLKVSII